MSIFKYLFQIITLDIISKAIFGIISILIIRFLSVEEFAIYSISIALINIVSSSVSSIFNRLYIAGGIDKSLPKSSFFTYQILLTAVIFIFLLPMSSIFNNYFSIIFLATLSQVLFLFVQTHFQASLNFKVYYLSDFTRIAIYSFSFISLICLNTLNTMNILIVYCLSSLSSFIFFGVKLLRIKDLLDLRNVIIFTKSLLHGNEMFLLLYSLIVILFSYTDLLMLKYFSTEYSVAIFAAAFTYYGFLRTILNSIHKLMLPLVQKSKSIDEIRSIMKNFSYLSFTAFPLFIMIIFLSDFFIPFLDNNKYPESIKIFKILAISSYFSFLFSPYVNIVFRAKNAKFLFQIYSIIFSIYLLTSPIIIIFFDVIGLAIFSLFAWLLLNFITFLKSQKILFNSKDLVLDD